jgi:ABC-type uncharacterized transport system involved in gliding motility auxiliary subunit
MNRTVRAIVAVLLVGVIMFCAMGICQKIGRNWRLDVTEQKLYTLSDGTRAILAKLHQPITLKLFYTKTAALQGPDQIRYFNNYYNYVRALLEEFTAAAKGKIELQVIDPRPYSDEEVQALRYGLQRFAITEEESFFFGLVLQTPFGVEKSIPFFSPDRQNFVEYDISYLIDTAITRQKKRLGILSSLPVMGDDVSDYMAQMMALQGRRPRPAWTIVQQLRQQYEVSRIPTDIQEVNDVDILLVIHPKKLPEKTLFAIDQFVLDGGRLIVCVDPFCFADRPDPLAGQAAVFTHEYGSELNQLLRNWCLEMPENTFTGDRALAWEGAVNLNSRAEKVIGFLELNRNCVNTGQPMTAQLNLVLVLFAGALKELTNQQSSQVHFVPLLQTTDRGNTWTAGGPYEIVGGQFGELLSRFVDGTKPVTMAYLITGKFKSCFPNGIEIEQQSEQASPTTADPNEQNAGSTMVHLAGLTESSAPAAIVVFADVDFISDGVAYQETTFFGKAVVGDNSALLLNAIDTLAGSSELISMRSRGSFSRPFTVVEQIELQAEKETAEEEARINAQIAGFRAELNNILAAAKQGEEEIVGASILQKRKQIELEIRRAEQELRRVKMHKRESIEQLGDKLRNFCTLPGPVVTLVVAIMLGVRRGARRRYYISHASDA